MVTLKMKLLVPVAAVAAVGFGVVWGNAQQPGRQPGEPLRPLFAVDPPAGPPASADHRIKLKEAIAVALEDGKTATHRTPNFVVHGPTPLIARAVAAEAEFQRGLIAKTWLGKTLPVWGKPATITVTIDESGTSGGATTFTFGSDKSGPQVGSIEMKLHGSLLTVLGVALPHQVVHTVLATHFGKPLPRWADTGIAILNEPDDERFNHDVRCRELLNAGRGIRLKTLFRMTEYPRDMIVLYAQGYSVARFLLSQSPTAAIPLPKDDSPRGKLFQYVTTYSHPVLLEFVRIGMDGNTAESWDKAAEDVYGFESVDKLEEAWLESLRQPPVRVTPRAKPKDDKPKPKDDKPDLIPPTNLPGTTPQPGM